MTRAAHVPLRFAATLTVALVFLYEAGAYLFFGLLARPRTGLLAVGPLVVLLPLVGILRGARYPVAATLRITRVPWAAVPLGVIAVVGAVPPVLAVASRLVPVSPATERFFSDLLAAATPVDWMVLILVAAVIPSLTEEILFRGFLQRSLEERLGRTAGVLIAAAAFGLIHGPSRALSAGALGAVLGWLTARSGSVVPAIIAHAVVNTVAISVVNSNGFGQGNAWPETLPWPALLIWAAISLGATVLYARIPFRTASP